METRTIKFYKSEKYLTDVFEREGYEFNSIPTNCILDKTIPGLGATHSELIAERPSIIIEPNIPVIIGKTKGKEKKYLPVYEKIKDGKIESYLQNDQVKNKKIICTPESYMRVQKIAVGLGINIYQEYFCLIDECEKITQDNDYRENITLPIRDFFLFESKAFVSATPLDVRDQRFAAQGFYKLKVEPEFDYRKDINLIITNRYELTVIEKLQQLRDSERVCIFLNSTNGINKLVNHLEEQGVNDFKAFCSQKSVLKFKDRRIKGYENLDMPLAKYNFFTSRFFSAVDIIDDKLPDILILTDLNEAKYTRIDPATSAIQIYGRFRKKFNGVTFNSLTHIANVDSEEEVLTNEEIETYLDESELLYRTVKNKLDSEDDKGRVKLLSDDLHKLTFNRFLYEDGEKNEFAIDNLYDEEKVKRNYLTAESLDAAYQETDHFNVNVTIRNEPIDDRTLLRYKKLRSAIERRKLIVQALDKLSDNGENLESDLVDYVTTTFTFNDDRDITEEALYIIDAYEKLGSEAIKAVDYYKTRIDALLLKFEKDSNLDKMRSEKVQTALKEQIWENTELEEVEALRRMQYIFDVNGITEPVKFATLKKFGGVNRIKAKDKKEWIKLWKFQPDSEYLI